MTRIKCIIILTVAWFALTIAPVAYALDPPSTKNIRWKEDNINWPQLEKVFSQNPNYNDFTITFPNGLSWDVDASVMVAMHEAYKYHANLIGLKGDLPELVFSSLEDGYHTHGGKTSIPIGKFSQNLQEGELDLLNELDAQKYNLWQYLPEWLQNFLTKIWDWITDTYDSAVSHLKR